MRRYSKAPDEDVIGKLTENPNETLCEATE